MSIHVNQTFFGVEILVDLPSGRQAPILDRNGKAADFTADFQNAGSGQFLQQFLERVDLGGSKIISQ